MQRTTALFASFACSFGCDSQAGAPPDTGSVVETDDTVAPEALEETAPDTVPDAAPDADGPATYSLSIGGWTLQPSQETTRCVTLRLGNTEKIWVPRIRTSLAAGSHHFVIYRSDATVEEKTPFECIPFVDTLFGGTIPLMISQRPEETVELPPDVAFELEPNQMIRLEAHYLNYYPDPITANASVTFEALPAGDPPLVADFMFVGTTSIVIPRNQTVTSGWHYFEVPAGLEVFAVTGHTHRLGTNVEVERATGADAGEPVYPEPGKPFKWSESPVAFFSPPMVFGEDEGFRFRCSWKNTTNQPVFFGESANAEMCFFWAYYYPSRGFITEF